MPTHISVIVAFCLYPLKNFIVIWELFLHYFLNYAYRFNKHTFQSIERISERQKNITFWFIFVLFFHSDCSQRTQDNLMSPRDVAVTLDPSHACECGLEDQSGKEDTPQITIAVLMVRRVNVLTDLLNID